MKSFTGWLIGAATLIAATMSASTAEEPATSSPAAGPARVTFLMTGLHCPACTRTVEASLQRAKGIESVKVDWKTKTARVEFDDDMLTAQALAQLIAKTPHMMGRSLHYAGWLAIKVPTVKDVASGEKAEKTLLTVEGVESAKAYADQHIVAVYFASKGNVSTADLLAALQAAGTPGELD